MVVLGAIGVSASIFMPGMGFLSNSYCTRVVLVGIVEKGVEESDGGSRAQGPARQTRCGLSHTCMEHRSAGSIEVDSKGFQNPKAFLVAEDHHLIRF